MHRSLKTVKLTENSLVRHLVLELVHPTGKVASHHRAVVDDAVILGYEVDVVECVALEVVLGQRFRKADIQQLGPVESACAGLHVHICGACVCGVCVCVYLCGVCVCVCVNMSKQILLEFEVVKY